MNEMLAVRARRIEDELRAQGGAPITGAELARRCELRNEKRVSDAIAYLRRECGLPIVAGQHGYWLATSREEVQAYVEALDQRIEGLVKTRRAVAERYKQTWHLPLVWLTLEGAEDDSRSA